MSNNSKLCPGEGRHILNIVQHFVPSYISICCILQKINYVLITGRIVTSFYFLSLNLETLITGSLSMWTSVAKEKSVSQSIISPKENHYFSFFFFFLFFWTPGISLSSDITQPLLILTVCRSLGLKPITFLSLQNSNFIHKMALAWIPSATLYVGGRRQEKCCGRWLKINKNKTSSVWNCLELWNVRSSLCKPGLLWRALGRRSVAIIIWFCNFFVWILLRTQCVCICILGDT